MYEKVFWILNRAWNEIINSKKKKIKLLTKEQQESYGNSKICDICKWKFENKYLKDNKCHKGRDYWHYTGEYRGGVHRTYNLRYSVSKRFPITFHNG